MHIHYFFYLRKTIFGYWVEGGQIKKHKYFFNYYLGGVDRKKNWKPVFYGTQSTGV
jgi:hypothetical protein